MVESRNSEPRHEHGRQQQGQLPRAHRRVVHQRVGAAQPAHQQRVALLAVLAQQHGGKRGDDGEGRHQRAGDGVGVGLGHRAEDAPLDAAHGEERDEGDDDDQQGEGDRLAHLAPGPQDGEGERRKAADLRTAAWTTGCRRAMARCR
jgi:hypothetical protein